MAIVCKAGDYKTNAMLTITVAPSLANSIACNLPIPCPAPVTNTISPEIFFGAGGLKNLRKAKRLTCII